MQVLNTTSGLLANSWLYQSLTAHDPTHWLWLLLYGVSTPARHPPELECGWRIQPGALDEVTQLLLDLAANQQQVSGAGAGARLAFQQYLDLPIAVAEIRVIVLGADIHWYHL